jgi:hypothetical protein
MLPVPNRAIPRVIVSVSSCMVALRPAHASWVAAPHSGTGIHPSAIPLGHVFQPWRNAGEAVVPRAACVHVRTGAGSQQRREGPHIIGHRQQHCRVTAAVGEHCLDMHIKSRCEPDLVFGSWQSSLPPRLQGDTACLTGRSQSILEMVHGVSSAEGVRRKALAASRVSPSPLSLARDHSSQERLIPGKRQ